MKNSEKTFKAGEWFKLFLVCLFPLHVWTLLMTFRDINWVAERSDMWDAIGFSGYAMLYTLVESAFLFGFVALLSLLVPRTWGYLLKFNTLSLTAFVLAGWSIMEQLILIVLWTPLRHLAASLPFLVTSPFLRNGVFALLVTLTILLPLLLMRRSTKLQQTVYDLLDRLTLLSGLYLIIDAAAIILIIVRNIP